MKSSAALKIFFATCLIQLFGTQVYANTCVAAAGGTSGSPLLWQSAATWTNCGGVYPTAADDAQIGASTLYLKIDDGSLARSADFTGFTGTLSYGTSIGTKLSLGDGTAGLSNIALKLDSGMTVSSPAAGSMQFNFVSTSATQQTVDFAGKAIGDIQFNGAGGRWALVSGFVTATTNNVFYLSAGTLDMDGVSGSAGLTHSMGMFSVISTTAKTLSMGNATVNLGASVSTAFNVNAGSNLTVSANTGTINMTGTVTFYCPTTDWNGMSVAWTGAGGYYSGDNSTFKNFTVTTTAVKTNSFLLNSTTPQITGTLSLNGNSASNRLLVASATFGTSRGFNLSGASASMTGSHVDFKDIAVTSSGGAPATPIDLSAISGGSGDCLGNSGITFTTAANQYWYLDAGNWSDAGKWFLASGGAGGAGRVPLPQDDVFFDANSFNPGGQTVTLDMPRAGKSISWTGAANTPSWAKTTASTIYGGLTLIAGMSNSGTTSLTFEGRGAIHTITSNTQVISNPVYIQMPGGTFRLADAASFGYSPAGGGLGLNLNKGTFDAATNNAAVTVAGTFNSNNTDTRAILMGNGNWTLSSSGVGASVTVWNTATTSNLTLTPGGSTILITDTGSQVKTFSGGGLTYNNLTITGSGSGSIDFVGANTFNTFTINSPKTVRFTAGTTTTFTSFVASGTASNSRVTISSTAGGTHTLSQAAGTVNSDWLSLTNSIATGGATWNAGCNSIRDASNTSGWIFDCIGNFFQML